MRKLDVHSLNRYEAKIHMKSFLKESYELRIYTVLIAHGYGDLVLKKELYKLKKEMKIINSINDAPYQLGGGGASLVTLKRKKNYGKRI